MKAYQLKISIKDVKPPLWRRCMVPVRLSFAQLAEAIHVMMGWSGEHMDGFRLPKSGHLIEIESRMAEQKASHADEMALEDYLEVEKWFEYTYDYGADWKHKITIEDVTDVYDKDYPEVIKFKGNNPEEDCDDVYDLSAGRSDSGEQYDLSLVNEILTEPRFRMKGLAKAQGADLESFRDFSGGVNDTANLFKSFSHMAGIKGLSEEKQKEAFKNFLDMMAEQMESDADDEEGLEEECVIECVPEQLAEVIQRWKKAALIEYAHEKDLQINQSLRKAELARQIAEQMLEPGRMKRYLLWLPVEEMYQLLRQMDIDDAGWIEERLPEQDLTDWVMDDFCDTGYGILEIDEAYVAIPSDVVKQMRKILTKDFFEEYQQYWWLDNALSIATDFYQLIPTDIFQQILALWPGFHMSWQEVEQAIQKRPADLLSYRLLDEYIVSELMPWERQSKFARHEGDVYFIPQEDDVWNHEIMTPPAHQAMQLGLKHFVSRWGDIDDDFFELMTEFSIGLMAGMSEQEMEEILAERYDGDFEEDGFWRDIRFVLRKIEPYMRKAVNHGFTDEEMKRRKKEAKRLLKAENKTQQNKVVSLDEQRRKRKHKKHNKR